MLNKTLIALSVASISTVIPLKAEEKGVYLFGSAGLGTINDIDFINLDDDEKGKVTYDNGFSPEIGIGYDFGSLRTEVSYSIINSDTNNILGQSASNDENKVKTFYLSAAYDFRADKKWQPYIGVGVGKSEVENSYTIDGEKAKASEDGLTTVRFKLGVTYAASDNLDIFGEAYRANTEDISQTVDGTRFTVKDLSASGISLGLRYKL